jgi:hypothetical protein
LPHARRIGAKLAISRLAIEMSGLRATLRVADFRALLVSYVVNRAGDVVGALALAVIVFAKTGSALATTLLFLATQFLPGLIGPALVARVDRRAPGRILPVMYLIECSLFLLLALIVEHAGTAAIVALAFLDATLALAARAITRSAVATTLIPFDLMPEGKAAFNVALAVAMIAGPVIAGVTIALVGSQAALLIDAGSFLAAAFLIARAAGLRSGADAGVAAARGRVRDGLRYISGHPALRALILGE